MSMKSLWGTVSMKSINQFFQVALFVFTAKPRSFIANFSRKTIGFHRQSKFVELNFLLRKTFLQMVRPDRQYQPHSQLISLVPGP